MNIISIFLIIPLGFFSTSIGAQNRYIEDQNRAKALLSQCTKPEAERRGSQASKDCLEGNYLWTATSERLNRDIADTMQKREDDRRRVQQEEIWREQVRRR